MPPSGYLMSPELKRAVQDMIRVYGNSFQPRPKRGRRVRRGGGGGNTSFAATLYVVTTEITAATGDTDEVTPGEGEAIQYEFDEEGVATPMDMEPVAILNYDPGQVYAINVGIYVADVPGTELRMVLSAHCTPYDEPA